ncbi:MAG: hypothetical protein ABR559_05460 [Gemmatimonadota bacterium]
MSGLVKRCVVLAGSLLLLACAKEAADEAVMEEPAADSLAAAAVSLADVAGTWDMRAVPVTGDTTATVFQLEATADGWFYHLPEREPITVAVVVSGDSIIADAGPYESVRRPGTQVTTHAVYRLEGQQLVGDVQAHYATAGADSTLTLQSTGTRAP